MEGAVKASNQAVYLPPYLLEVLIAALGLFGLAIGWFTTWKIYMIALFSTVGLFGVMFSIALATSVETTFLWNWMPVGFVYVSLRYGAPILLGSLAGRFLRKRI